MTPRQRLELVLAGRQPDRPAVSFWRHQPRREITADGLVQGTIEFQKRFGWDLVKINPRAEYHAEVWGNRYAFYEDDHRRPSLIQPRVQSPADWRRLEQVAPNDGVLGQHLAAVRAICAELGEQVPVVMTVFTPLSIAAELAGVRRHRPADWFDQAEELHAGLQTITETFCRFVKELLAAGCDGLFFATTRFGSRANLSNDQFHQFSRPYDLKVLQAAHDAQLNVLHVCGPQAMLDITADYPVQVLSWDMVEPSNPGPRQVAEQSGKVVMGGIAAELTTDWNNAERVRGQARELIEQAGSQRAIIAAGCVVPTNVDDRLLADVRRLVEQWRRD